MHKRIYFSANFICILLFLHGCASSPGSSSNSSSRDSAKAKSTTSSQKKLSSVENISSTESISKNESPSTFDENSNLRSAAESIEHQGGEVDPTIKESVQTASTEKFEQSIDVHEDHFPEEKEKKLDTPSIADSSLILQEHSELKSFFDSKQENENSNANKKDGSFLSPSAGFENKTNKPVNLNPAQTRIDFLEGNQSDNSKLAIDSHLQKKSYPSGNILLGNSDLPVSNPREHESNFTNEKKMISVDNKNLKSKFSPRTSSVEIIDPISETENKVGFRGVDKDKDSSLYRQKEVSFLAEPSEDFIKDESVQLSKIVSFKDEPNKDIEKQNTKAQGNIAFSKKNKPLSSSIIKTMPSVGYSDPISNKTQDHIFNTPSTALKHRPERELGYNNLKSFLDRNEDPTSKTSKDEENKFLNVRGYLEEAREEQPDYNLSEGIIKGKTRFLRTLEWIENRGRVQEDLQTE